MIKKLLLVLILISPLITIAQEGTASPYSFFGIGDVRFKGTVENSSMAGVSVEQDSIHINLENPASFSNLKLTSFAIGASNVSNKLKSNSGIAQTTRTSIDYLAVGLPLGKLGFGFGLIPYSSVGYKIETTSTDANATSSRQGGSGGINKVFLGASYKIKPNFSVGADLNYNFGQISANNLQYIPNITIASRELYTANITGVNFNIGAMYQAKINKKITLFTSLNYALQSSLSSQNTRNVSTVVYNTAFDLSTVDTFTEQTSSVTLHFPSKISFSAGIGVPKKWLIGGKISYQKKPGEANEYNFSSNVGYGRYSSISLGGFFIPNYNSFSSYPKRIVYRGGIRYERTGIVINGKSINDAGFTLGLGLPITGVFSNINLGFEMGKRGTTTANLVQENYLIFRLGFSLNDKWFVKSKFN